MVKEIASLLVCYYYAYRLIDHPNHVQETIEYVADIISNNLKWQFPYIDTIDSISIFDFPYTKTYLMNNDVCFETIQSELIHYAYKQHHIINYNDIILFINVVPFDGLDITHRDIIRILDPIN